MYRQRAEVAAGKFHGLHGEAVGGTMSSPSSGGSLNRVGVGVEQRVCLDASQKCRR